MKIVYIIFLATISKQCFAAESRNEQPEPISYFEQMVATQDAKAIRDGAACAANFLDEFAQFFPKSDPRYTTVSELTEQCIYQSLC